jgi:hypothetical protein
MEPHRWTAFRLIHGPVIIDGVILRAIEADDNRGGRLRAVERWSGTDWCNNHGNGVGWRNVLESACAPIDELRRLKISSDTFPDDYDPLHRAQRSNQ